MCNCKKFIKSNVPPMAFGEMTILTSEDGTPIVTWYYSVSQNSKI